MLYTDFWTGTDCSTLASRSPDDGSRQRLGAYNHRHLRCAAKHGTHQAIGRSEPSEPVPSWRDLNRNFAPEIYAPGTIYTRTNLFEKLTLR